MSFGLVVWTKNSYAGVAKSSVAKSSVAKSSVAKKKGHSITHPIFLHFAEKTTDDFWKKRFEKYSRNMFPSKLFFRSDILYYNYGIKSKQREIDLKNSDAQALIDFLNNSVAIMSVKDEIKFSAKTNVATATLGADYKCWNDVDSKLRETLLVNYSIKLKNKYELSSAETQALREILHLGFASSYFNNSTVTMSGNAIESISNLKVAGKKFSIEIKNKIKVNVDATLSRSKGVARKQSVVNSHTFSIDGEEVYVENNCKRFDVLNVWKKFIRSYKC